MLRPAAGAAGGNTEHQEQETHVTDFPTFPKDYIPAIMPALVDLVETVASVARRQATEEAATQIEANHIVNLGEPAVWQRFADGFGWLTVEPEDLAHYREKGSIMRPLYLAPPAPAADPVTAQLVEALRKIVDIWNGEGNSDSLGYEMYETARAVLAVDKREAARG